MAWSALALLCWMVVRLVSGADLYDGSHIVALAQRIAQGDLLFVDEMNAQAVGSAFGAPFVWVWTHLFGQNFLVLAYRWFYLLVAAGVGLFCYRALRAGGIRPLIAFTALAWALVITSYHVWGISYNTVPTLAMVLATCCGYAAVRGPRERAARWLVPVAVALPCGAISLQSLAPSMVVTAMVLLVLTWRRGCGCRCWSAWPSPAPSSSATSSASSAGRRSRPPSTTRWTTRPLAPPPASG